MLPRRVLLRPLSTALPSFQFSREHGYVRKTKPSAATLRRSVPSVFPSKPKALSAASSQSPIFSESSIPSESPYFSESPIPFPSRPPLISSPESDRFASLGVPFDVASLLAGECAFQRPTEIQSLALPVLLKGKSALLTSETGSGKTLAFLLPLVARMKSHEGRQGGGSDGPKIIVLSPTRELAAQLLKEAKMISHAAKFRARLWGNRMKVKSEEVDAPDVVVCSPLAFQRDMKWSYDSIQAVVLDECDAMLFYDSGFLEEIAEIVSKIPKNAQIVCVGATALKGDSWRWLQNIRRDAEMIKTIGANALPSTIKLEMVKVIDQEGFNKHPALERALSRFLMATESKSRSRCVIFCNSVSSARSTHHILSERFGDRMGVYCLHGDMRPGQRDENWKSFNEENKDQKHQILVCTDLSARGLDVRDVDEVIMFDIPERIPDFLHRAGRTGRAGKAGKVTFVVGRGEAKDVQSLFGSKF